MSEPKLASPTYKCPECGEDFVPELVDIDPDFYANHYRWRSKRLLIQDVWPNATTVQREQLLSGLCSFSCFDTYLNLSYGA